MRDLERETGGVPRRPPIASVVLAVSLGVLLVAAAVPVVHRPLPVPSGTLPALAIVGVVLAESLALYVGYGALAALLEPSIRELLGGDSA
ncbi:hypothetical protein ACFQGT_12085 [Natrialbaceae archaeon GCM10025810]|uniref:DUF7512 family protein n=1 Tax=Halovalidus salilacus TaxID=3075124 RepID=UPI003617BE92